MTLERPATSTPAEVQWADVVSGGTNGKTRSAFNQVVDPELLKQRSDRDRLSPMLAGVGWLEGEQFHLRLPRGDLLVQAPQHLLQTVLRHCDGVRTFNEILAASQPENVGELESFLLYLLDQGALVDAIYATREFARYAYQSMPIGLSAPDALTLGIGTRFVRPSPELTEGEVIDITRAPLDPFFNTRSSVYSFGDSSIEQQDLAALLWSMGGVVAAKHPRSPHVIPHRTLGSGGAMYLVRWMLVLQSPVGDYGPGVYDITFPRPRQVSVVHRSSDTRLLHRAYLKPWQLTNAKGAIFGIGNIDVAALRYRNRALQYLFMEAGAALQNMALTAPHLNMSTAIIGGYCEDTAARMLELKDEILVGSAIFGAPPSAMDRKATASQLPIDFVWSDSVNDVYDLPFHIARANPAGKEGNEFYTFGKDPDPRLAYVKAHAEAVERQGAREPKNIFLARADEAPNAVTPNQIAVWSPTQYGQPGFRFKRFNPLAKQLWVPATRWDDGASISVPAQFVYGRQALKAWQPRIQLHLQCNSSGCAAGPDLHFALEAGLLEVVERDAFMKHWLTQTPGQRILESDLPAKVAARVSHMRSVGCDVKLQLLHSVAAQVVLASATDHGKFFTCVTAAARYDRVQACSGALDELETMVFTRLIGVDVEKIEPQEVQDPRAHTMLYTQREYYRRADNVLTPRSHAPRQMDSCSSLEEMCELLLMQGYRPSYVDITPQRNSINQGRTPLTVVKAIVPGLIPMSFGVGREPRGMLPDTHPDSHFPHPFP